MALLLIYTLPNSRPVSLSLPSTCVGFVTSEDAEQVAEGLRTEQQREPLSSAVMDSCFELARKRRGGKREH